MKSKNVKSDAPTVTVFKPSSVVKPSSRNDLSSMRQHVLFFAGWLNPVFDGPQPRDKPLKNPPLEGLNTEADE